MTSISLLWNYYESLLLLKNIIINTVCHAVMTIHWQSKNVLTYYKKTSYVAFNDKSEHFYENKLSKSTTKCNLRQWCYIFLNLQYIA